MLIDSAENRGFGQSLADKTMQNSDSENLSDV